MHTRLFLIFLLVLLSVAPIAQGQNRRRSNAAGQPMPTTNAPLPVMMAPQAHLLEGMTMNSSLLNRGVRYSIYLPPDYYVSNRRYPVVYLLHGYTDDETGWTQFGEADRIVEQGIRSGTLPPMILVMPDAGVTWYMNDYLNKTRYEDMFVSELIPHIDSTYRTRTKRNFRGVSGLSMGGHGSLLLAMHHPDLFGSCAALSAAVYTDETMKTMPDETYDKRFSFLLSGPVKGDERLTAHYKRNSPLILAASAPEGDLKKVRWYLDCGDDDFLSAANAQLHMTLTSRKISHEYRVRDGAHTWNYWRSGLTDALQFIGTQFHQ